MKLRKGFTLIELLVVIAIIALLLSILMPSLQKVKKQAQTVICRSNLKQLNLGLVMYVNDFDGKFWLGYDYLDPSNSNWWMPAVKQYAGDIGKLRFCPAATKLRTRKDGTNGIGAGKEPYTAWGFNSWLDGISPLKDCDYGSYASNGWVEDKPANLTTPITAPKYWRRYNKIDQSNTVPFLTDGQWIDGWPNSKHDPKEMDTEGQQWGSSDNSHFIRFLQNRHNKNQNVLFMDGSVSLVGLKQMWTFKWHRQYNTRDIYTKADGAGPSSWPEWMKSMKAY